MRWLEIITEMTRHEASGFLAQHGINASNMTPAELKVARRTLARKLHPDRSGSVEPMQLANAAIDTMLKGDETDDGTAPEAPPASRSAKAWLAYLRGQLPDFRQSKMSHGRVYLHSPFLSDNPYFVRIAFEVSPRGEITGRVLVEVNPNANTFVKPVSQKWFDLDDMASVVETARHAFDIIKTGRAERAFGTR